MGTDGGVRFCGDGWCHCWFYELAALSKELPVNDRQAMEFLFAGKEQKMRGVRSRLGFA